jgi:hypothetical protein
MSGSVSLSRGTDGHEITRLDDKMMNDSFPKAHPLSTRKSQLLRELLKKKKIELSQMQAISRRIVFSPCVPSFAQQRLWFLDQLTQGRALYNISQAFRLQGRPDAALLQQTLTVIVARHESLRTSFAILDGQPVQIIDPDASSTLNVVDLSGLDEAVCEAEVQRLVAEENARPFELSVSPLLRAKLLRISAAEHVLVLTLHHIIADAWSLQVLTRELVLLYDSFSKGEPLTLPSLTIQYADYAVWQREQLQGTMLEQQLEYWKRQLTGAPSLNLAKDRPRPTTPGFRGADESLALPADLFNQLQELNRFEGVTMFMIVLAAFYVLLYKHTGQDDIVITSLVAGRNHLETESLIGCFINTLALRARLNGNPSFRELLDRVRLTALGAYAHQDIPFERVIAELSPTRSPSNPPFVQVMIGLQNSQRSTAELNGLELSPIHVADPVARCDLYLSLVEAPQTLSASIAYDVELFSAGTIARMLRQLEAILRHITTDPDVSLHTLIEMLAEDDRQQRIGKEKEFRDASRQRLKEARRKAVGR